MKYFIVAVIASLLFTNCSTTKTIKCPPNSTSFTIYKSIDKAYPVYAKDLNLVLRNSLVTTNKVADTASISIKQNVVKFRENLNNISSITQDLIKSNLLYYFSGICDENVRNNFSSFQKEIANITLSIAQAEAKISNSKSVSNESKNIKEAIDITENVLKKVESNKLKLN